MTTGRRATPGDLHLLRRAGQARGPLLFGRPEVEAARACIAAWPGYAPTPLLSLGALAARLGVGGIWYKQEADRFGIGSFKALGAGHALCQQLCAEVARRAGRPADVVDLLAGGARTHCAEITAICATDGNHGRALAWSAALLGCRAVVYVHAGVSPGRRAAIAAFGAEVVEAGANYDQSVRRAAEAAERCGWLLISDTAEPGYTLIPTAVMQGYTVLLAETIEDLPPGLLLTHLFVQAGVGGLAGAILDTIDLDPTTAGALAVIVEPERAACLYASAERGALASIEGPLDTIMAGLACGVPSLLGWQIVARRADACLRIPDQAAIDAMRLLARGEANGAPLVAGETGVAGLAGLLAVASDPERRRQLRLDRSSQILLLGTEGATDPELYARYVGATPAAVLAGQAGAGGPWP